MKVVRFLFALLLALSLFPLFPARSLHAQTPLRLGILGDSSSDEYRGSDNRGGAYANTTLNWAELLVRLRGVSLGAWGSRPEPRRTGFATNWARSGATTDTLISQGQHTGLAVQVAQGEIDLVILQIGSNDFAFYNEVDGYTPIYDGTLSGTALDAKINRIESSIRTTLDTVLAARHVPIIIGEIADWSNSPTVFGNPRYSDPSKRQHVTNAIARTNTAIRALATQRGLSVVNGNALAQRILGSISPDGTFLFGNEPVDFLTPGDEPHHALLSDAIHGGTIMNSILANLYIDTINTLLPGRLQPFTEAEILAFVGIRPTLSPTAIPATATRQPATATRLPATATDVPATVTRVPVTATTMPSTVPSVVATGTPITPTSTQTRIPTTTRTRTPTPSQTRTPKATQTPTLTRTRTVPKATRTPIGNQPPVAGDDSFLVSAGGEVVLTLAQIQQNDSDPDNDTLVIIGATWPSHGQLVRYSVDSAAYRPNPGFTGTDTIHYTISDGRGGVDTATISFVVK